MIWAREGCTVTWRRWCSTGMSCHHALGADKGYVNRNAGTLSLPLRLVSRPQGSRRTPFPDIVLVIDDLGFCSFNVARKITMLDPALPQVLTLPLIQSVKLPNNAYTPSEWHEDAKSTRHRQQTVYTRDRRWFVLL